MAAADPSHPDGCLGRTLTLLLLLAVLAVSRDMPPARASGLGLLPLKLRWSMAWAGLQVQSPFTPLAAQLLVAMDPDRRTESGRRAAFLLARDGSIRDRLRWSALLARQDRRNLPLLVRAVRAALAADDCGSLRAAIRATRSLPPRDRAKVTRQFRRPRLTRCAVSLR